MITYLIPPAVTRTSVTHVWDEAASSTLCGARIKVRSLWTTVDPVIHTTWTLTEVRGKLPICKVCRRKHENHTKNAPVALPMASQEIAGKRWSEYTPAGRYYFWAHTEYHR